MNKPEDEMSGFCHDDGTKSDPNLMVKPSLCTTCKKDDEEKEEMLCTMNKFDQQCEDEFIFEAYVSKFEVNTNENE